MLLGMKIGKPLARTTPAFDAQDFLDSSGMTKTVQEYARGETIFTQGDACEDVLYIQVGGVKLSVLLKTGREAVVAVLEPGDFFGEGCLAGQPVRMGSAMASTPSVVLLIAKIEYDGQIPLKVNNSLLSVVLRD
jgi:CRP-like cAMP-binding protein